MTRDEIKTLGFEELEKRALEIAEELADDETPAETVEERNEELNAIEERKLELNKEVEERKLAIEKVIEGEGKTIDTVTEERTMSNMEIRNTSEYIDAYAKYVRTGKDLECRALLTENVEGGTVPVPSFIENRFRQAWERDEVFSRVAKTFVRGNLKVGFEVSATDAEIHTEGDMENPKEEELILGTIVLIPQMVKKWITFSDEVLALGSEEFLNYIYDELAYKIIQKAADVVIEKILEAPAESTAEKVGVAQIEGDVTAATIIDAMAALGDEARDLVFIANGATIATVKKAALDASYAYDPFAGLTVIKKANVDGAIVGDLGGVQANLPEGESVRFKFDDLSLAEHDMIKLVGRLLAAIEVVGPKMLAVIGGSESE